MPFLKSPIKTHLFQRIILLAFSFFLCAHANSQSQEIETKQRALFILNMAQNFRWNQDKPKTDFDLIVLGDEELFAELEKLAANRKIDGRIIKPTFLVTSNQFINADLIYANRSFGFSAPRLLKAINKRNILLIGENYQYNECMVNLLNMSNDFLYELNLGKLRAHFFNPPESLINSSVGSATKWFELYQNSQKKLTQEKGTSQKQSIIIKQQQQFLVDIKNNVQSLENKLILMRTEINVKKRALDTLNKTFLNQEVVLKKRLLEVKKLENSIKQSNLNYNEKVKQSNSLNQIIKEQEEIVNQKSDKISKQELKIEDQTKTLSEQDYELKNQRRINALLLAILFLLGFIGFLIYRSYKKELKLNDLLQFKNEQITERNREIEQFTYIASHDLQAPVNTIVGFVQLLEHKLKGTLDEDDIINMNFIKESSDRMKRLIKDLLEYSQIGGETKKESFNLNQLINEVTDDLKDSIDTSKAKIHIYNPQDIFITGLHTDIRLLFQNLISNAIKFTLKSDIPRIHISLRQKTEKNSIKTICTIEDNGIGINDEHKKIVFDVFKRLHNETEYEGTGIGLAHCKKIVTKHNGEIWVENSTLGGSNFCFTLVHLLS